MEKTIEYLEKNIEHHDNQYWDLYERQQRYQKEFDQAKRLLDSVTSEMEEHKSQAKFYQGLLDDLNKNKNT